MHNYKKHFIEVWAQSIRGLPTALFRPVPVKRRRRAVFGSKTTRRSGSVGSRRRICPSQRSWERKIWTLKRVALHLRRVVAFETRSMDACAPSSESRNALFRCKRCRLHLPLLQIWSSAPIQGLTNILQNAATSWGTTF